MIGWERQVTQELIESLLNRTERLSASTVNLEKKDHAIGELRDELERLRTDYPELSADKDKLTSLNAVVGVIDIADSTRTVLGAAAGTPEVKAMYLRIVVERIAKEVEEVSKVTLFTGDGLQFVLLPSELGAGKSVRQKLSGLENTVFSDMAQSTLEHGEALARFSDRVDRRNIRLRIGIDAGEIFSGFVAGKQQYFGLPFVVASRLCAKKSLYQEAKRKILLTGDALDIGTQQGLWRGTDVSQIAKDVSLEGIAEPVSIHVLGE